MWNITSGKNYDRLTTGIELAFVQQINENLSKLASALGIQAASLCLVDPVNGQLHKAAEYGCGANLMDAISFSNGTGLSAWIAQKRRTIYLQDIHRGSRHGHAPVRSYLGLPVFLHDEVAGVLNLTDIVPNAFDNKFDAIHSFVDQFLTSLQRHVKQNHAPTRPRALNSNTAIPTEYEPKHPVD